MLRRLLILCLLLCSPGALASAQTLVEPHVPLGATWTMSIEQAQRLPALEHASDGTLRSSHTIYANSEIELVARWQGRAVSLLFARNFGLYAIGVAMVPWADQHSLATADLELQDLRYCAPIRVAVALKYGAPQGLAEFWEATEVTPLSENQRHAIVNSESGLIDWNYGRSWLIWEGGNTRLALGEQYLWYANRAGLAHHERASHGFESASLAVLEAEIRREAQRQRQLDEARQRVLPRAQTLKSQF